MLKNKLNRRLLNYGVSGLTGLATALIAKKLGASNTVSLALTGLTTLGSYAGMHGLWDYVDSKSPKKPAPANTETAKEMLESIRYAQLHYSVKNGGNGVKKFTSKQIDLSPSMPPIIYRSLVRGPGAELEPLDGYILRPVINTPTKFMYIAEPASGYTGKSYTINQSGNIAEIE